MSEEISEDESSSSSKTIDADCVDFYNSHPESVLRKLREKPEEESKIESKEESKD